MSVAKPQRKLSLFDVTNLVIGAIIGADIYVASSFGAGYLGPFSLVVWVNRHRDCALFCTSRDVVAEGWWTVRLRQRGMGTVRGVHCRLVAVVGGVDFAGGFSFSVR